MRIYFTCDNIQAKYSIYYYGQVDYKKFILDFLPKQPPGHLIFSNDSSSPTGTRC